MGNTLTWDLVIRDRGTEAVGKFRRSLEGLAKDSSSDLEKGFEKVRASTQSMSGSFLRTTAIIGGGATALVHTAAAAHALAAEGLALSGTLGVLPGIAGAAAIGVVTLKLATNGFAAALKDTNPKKLARDLKTLSPEARKTAVAIGGIRPQLKALQRSVQDKFFAGMAKDIKPLAAQYLPMLKRSLGDIGGSLGGVVKDFVKFARTPAATKLVSIALVNVSMAFQEIRAALAPLGPAILRIFSTSAAFLPSITSGLTGMTTRFGAFIAKVSASGQLTAWIRTGLDSVIALGQGFSAAAHGVATFVQGLNGSTAGGIKGLFGQIKTGSDAVTSALPRVIAAVVALAPAFANIVQSAGGSFGQTLKLAANAAIALAPALTTVTQMLIPLAPILGKIVPLIYAGSVALKGWGILTSIIDGVLIFTKVMFGLDVALDANVISVIVLALAALAIGIVVAYKKCETFRNIVQFVFRASSTFVLMFVDSFLEGLRQLFSALGKIPGKIGAPFRAGARSIGAAQAKVHALQAAINNTHGKNVAVNVTTKFQSIYLPSRGQLSGKYGAGLGMKAKAAGGPVMAGHPYLVGEHRPEVFVPAQNGVILPRVSQAVTGGASWSGGGGITVNISGGTIIGTSADFRRAVVEAVNSGRQRGARVSI